MATRTVTVRLRADISNYTRGMRQASDTTSRLANGGAAVGAAMLAGFAVAAASAAKFDKALSGVRAVSGATSAQMKQLRAAALDAGKTTSFSATEAANAEAELARAGVSVANITGGALKGALALAASGQVDVAEAAVTAAQAMNTFGLQGKDVTHIADLLAAGANKTAADVHGLGAAMRMGGLLAHQTGLSIEDTVGTLSAFADHALIGSDAGTSLKTMLQRLVPQSKEAQQAMDRIGFSAYDSTGKFVGLSELAGRMKTSFSKLTPEARNSAMATIFGADAVRSATILYELGSQGIDKYVKSVDDSGAAQRMAAIQTDNLMGDLERLRGALEVALIEGGSAANGALRDMTKWVTALVSAYNDLPPGLQHTVTGFMGIGGAVTLAGSAMLLLLPRIAATRAALASMGVTAARARTAIRTIGTATAVIGTLAAITYGVSELKKQLREAPPSTSKLANALLDLGQKGAKSGELTKKFGGDLGKLNDAVKQIAHPNVADRLHHMTEDWQLMSDKSLIDPGQGMELGDAKNLITGIDDALKQLVESGATDDANAAFLALSKTLDGTSPEKFKSLLPGYTDALANVDTQSKLTGGSQKELADQAAMTADEMKDQRSAAEQLTDALKSLNGINISAAEQEISFRQSLADLTGAVKENGHSLDVTTEKGRNIKGAFLDAAKAAMEHAQAVAEQKNSVEAGNDVLTKDIGLLKDTMHAAGFSQDAIDKLTAAYTQLPDSAETKVSADTKAAVKDLQTVQDNIRGTKGKSFTMSALTGTAEKTLKGLGYKVTHMKDGRVKVSVPTGSAIGQVGAIQRAINGIQGKPVGIGVYLKATGADSDANGVPDMIQHQANGAVVDYYANGGMRENHVAQIAPAGSWRVWGEPETGGEAYIPLAREKRPRSRQIAAETVGRLGGRVEWYASGGLSGFTYTPTGASVLGGPTDAKSRYDKELADLKKAWDDLNKALSDAKKKANSLKDAEKNLSKVRHGHHTARQLEAAKDKVADAKKAKKTADAKVKAERQDVYDADKALGVKKGAKAPTSFNLAAYQLQLSKSVAATEKWRKNLSTIGKRGGEEVRTLLESMGEEGYSLVNALAGASDKQFKDIVSKLQKTGEAAKATLADFTQQLTSATKVNQQFATDLQTLASQGYGDLAQALAAQGDANAQALAHTAATGKAADVAKANAAVGKAGGTLSGEDLSHALLLLTTLRGGSGRGYAELLAAGLDPGTIRDLVPKMLDQIKRLPAQFRDVFLKQFTGQTGIKTMARGGILTGPQMVLGGEAGVPESWIPHDGSSRSRSLLQATARLMGYDARPASRFGSGSGGGGGSHYDQRVTNLTLNGAKQSSAEQANDLARHLTFIA